MLALGMSFKPDSTLIHQKAWTHVLYRISVFAQIPDCPVSQGWSSTQDIGRGFQQISGQ